jgi:Putative zinc-finger
MQGAPPRQLPRRPPEALDPAAAVARVGRRLTAIDEPAARALALVQLAGRSREHAAAELDLGAEDIAAALARGRKALRRSLCPLPGSGWCERAERMLSDDMDGALEPPGPARLDVHLRNCPRCVEHQRLLGEALERLAAEGNAPGTAAEATPDAEPKPEVAHPGEPGPEGAPEPEHEPAPGPEGEAAPEPEPEPAPREAAAAREPEAAPAPDEAAEAESAPEPEAEPEREPAPEPEAASPPAPEPQPEPALEPAPQAAPAPPPPPETVAAPAPTRAGTAEPPAIARSLQRALWNTLFVMAVVLAVASLVLTAVGITEAL